MRKHQRKSLLKQVVSIVLLLLVGIMVFWVSVTAMKQGEIPLLNNIFFNTSEADVSQGWNLILVNKDYRIPDNYNVELMELSNGEKVDSRIYPELQEMFDAARASGLELFVREGYRTQEEQQEIMEDKIRAYQEEGYSKKEAKELAEKYVAVIGTSEHQLGLSVDINADTTKCSSEAVYGWLDENAYKYGFIKRYPADKITITGINNEPWHYRYVGRDAAKEMEEKGMCLEEYVEWLKTQEQARLVLQQWPGRVC